MRIYRPKSLKSMDELDKRISKAMGKASREEELNSLPRFDHGEHSRIMLDLMVLAFWSDSTRVSTFMFGNDVTNRNFSFIDGVNGGHHSISHHQNNGDQLDQYEKINRWHTEQYAYMLERMKGIKEGDGTLLDHSMVAFGSPIRDGNSHNPRNVPIVVAGECRTASSAPAGTWNSTKARRSARCGFPCWKKPESRPPNSATPTRG